MSRRLDRARLERETRASLNRAIKNEVSHQVALATRQDFSVFSPLWYMKNDIQALHERLEDVYRTHADRRAYPRRADRGESVVAT